MRKVTHLRAIAILSTLSLVVCLAAACGSTAPAPAATAAQPAASIAAAPKAAEPTKASAAAPTAATKAEPTRLPLAQLTKLRVGGHSTPYVSAGLGVAKRLV